MSLVHKMHDLFSNKVRSKNIKISEFINNWSQDTLPIVDFDGKIGLVWSARSACSLSVFWYFAVTNQIQEALDFDEWPHKYREHVLAGVTTKKAKSSTLGTKDISWVRVMRDPFERSISSYRHFVENVPEENLVREFFDYDVKEKGVSFEGFLNYVKSRDVKTCDIHFRQQWCETEYFCPNAKIVNADKTDLKSFLFNVKEPIDKNQPLFEESEKYIFNNHIAKIGQSREKEIDSKTIMPASHIRILWPGKTAFDTPETRAIVREIYAEDYLRFKKYL